ncbi:histidine kinase sensor of two-component system [Bifidobacterium tissieri]|uniref:histidine kinase n=2 Tax=Bifidobacterium tissieri TaxID=1630162 RepID=A0A261FFI2_9BIFI|nr:histidine kinase sensor of two-component system [Bifidobacterium tissieri]
MEIFKGRGTIRRIMTTGRGNLVLIPDTLLALVLTSLCTAITGYGSLQDGLLFHYADNNAVLQFWTWMYCLPLAFRRRLPRASAIAFVLLCLIQLVFGPALVFSNCFALIHVYTVIVYGERDAIRAFIVIAAGMTLVAAGVNAGVQDFGPLTIPVSERHEIGFYDCVASGVMDLDFCNQTLRTDFLLTLMMIAAPLAAVIVMGYWQRAKTQTVRMMQERNAALESRREEEAHIAALAERARIARDMHDVVAHTLSIIIVQADGGRFAGANDPVLARSTMETIRHESVRALGDMKRLLGIFGAHTGDVVSPISSISPIGGDDGTDTNSFAHAPGYADIAGLVRQADAASTDVRITHTVLGTPNPDRLSTLAASTAYRVVQEALTNVRKYAGTNVHVSVEERWSEDGLMIRVSDDGRGLTSADDGHKPGYGLIGMRERLDSLGGSCSAGPRLGGGFEVTTFIPFPGGDRSGVPASSAQSMPITQSTSSVQSAVGAVPTPTDGQEPVSSSPAPTTEPVSTSVTGQSNQNDDSTGIASGLKQALLEHHRSFIRSVKQLGALPDSPERSRLNVIERLSQWTERHYLIMDTLYVVLILVLFGAPTNEASSSTDGSIAVYYGSPALLGWSWSNIIVTVPLIWRRRFPQASAAVFAVLTILQLLFLPWITVAGLVSVYSVYSVTLYGPRTARRWVIPTIGIGSVLFAVKVMVSVAYGINTIFRAITMLAGEWPAGFIEPSTMSLPSVLWAVAIYTVATFITLMGAMAAGMWSRSRGSNLLVLQAREEALRAEERKQKILAANMERDRISANIQTDVTDTLLGVIGKTDAGLRTIDSGNADADSIAAAFEGIATEGRAALKRMRQLLGVLRETGFSDETPRKDQMRLVPAVSLDEQLELKQ